MHRAALPDETTHSQRQLLEDAQHEQALVVTPLARRRLCQGPKTVGGGRRRTTKTKIAGPAEAAERRLAMARGPGHGQQPRAAAAEPPHPQQGAIATQPNADVDQHDDGEEEDGVQNRKPSSMYDGRGCHAGPASQLPQRLAPRLRRTVARCYATMAHEAVKAVHGCCA